MAIVSYQACYFMMGSYGYPANIMSFDLKLLKFNHGTSTNLDYSIDIEAMPAQEVECLNDNYSVVGFKLVLERHYNKHLINYVLPSFIFVITSWISFVIPPEIVPGRMTLLITLLLVLISLFGTIVRTQPPTTSPTALVAWTLFCMMFVIGALLAYAAILYYQFRMDKKSAGKVTNVSSVSVFDSAGKSKSSLQEKSTVMDMTVSCKNWDRNFLVCFPTLFFIFNLVYWPVVAWNNRESGAPILNWNGTSIKV